jgi:hypothetical protein
VRSIAKVAARGHDGVMRDAIAARGTRHDQKHPSAYESDASRRRVAASSSM